MLDDFKNWLIVLLGGVPQASFDNVKAAHDGAINALANVMQERDEFRDQLSRQVAKWNVFHRDAKEKEREAENRVLNMQLTIDGLTTQNSELALQIEMQNATIEQLTTENMQLLGTSEAYMNANPPMHFEVIRDIPAKTVELVCVIGTDDSAQRVTVRRMVHSNANIKALLNIGNAVDEAKLR